MRDHRKLRAFELADELTLEVYSASSDFPRREDFGLTSQLRRASLSIASNIVEGAARPGKGEYLHFLSIAYSSAREVEYQLSLARRLGYLKRDEANRIEPLAEETSKVLNGLIRSLRRV